MIFKTEQDCVFLSADSGVFANDDGQKFEWYKLKVADPMTYENHELVYKKDLEFSKLQKGQKVKLELMLEPTNKKSRVIVSNYRVA